MRRKRARKRAGCGANKKVRFGLVFAAFSDKFVDVVAEEDIEGGEGAVALGDVLLEVYFLLVVEVFGGIDFLLHDADAVAEHDDFVEEFFHGELVGLEAAVAGVEDHFAFDPFIAERDELLDVGVVADRVFDDVFYFFPADESLRGLVDLLDELELVIVFHDLYDATVGEDDVVGAEGDAGDDAAAVVGVLYDGADADGGG